MTVGLFSNKLLSKNLFPFFTHAIIHSRSSMRIRFRRWKWLIRIFRLKRKLSLSQTLGSLNGNVGCRCLWTHPLSFHRLLSGACSLRSSLVSFSEKYSSDIVQVLIQIAKIDSTFLLAVDESWQDKKSLISSRWGERNHSSQSCLERNKNRMCQKRTR